jgi:hypothetical protein
MIYGSGDVRKIKKVRQVTQNPCQDRGLIEAGLLQQIEFFGAADGSPAVVHPQLGVNILGVGPHGVQRHHELTGNFRAVQIGPQQPEHFQLTLA